VPLSTSFLAVPAPYPASLITETVGPEQLFN
jgi:hypothetical protein